MEKFKTPFNFKKMFNNGCARSLLTPVIILTAIFLFVLICLLSRHIIIAYKLNSMLAELKANGRPTNLKELNSFYQAVPDQENAAKHYVKAFSLMDELLEEQREDLDEHRKQLAYIYISGYARLPPLGHKMDPEKKKYTLNYLKQYKKAITHIRTAVTLKKSRFPIDFKEGFNYREPLNNFRESARLLYIDSLFAAEDGEVTACTKNITSILKIGQALEMQPTITSFLAQVACIAIAVDCFERCLNIVEFDDNSLKKLIKEFQEAEKSSDNTLRNGLIGELVLYMNFYEAGVKNNDNISDKQLRYFAVLDLLDYTTLNTIKFIEISKKEEEYLFLPIKKASEKAKKLEKEIDELSNTYIFIKMLKSYSPYMCYEKKQMIKALLYNAIIAASIERYKLKYKDRQNNIPDELIELVPDFMPELLKDPFTDEEFKYDNGSIKIKVSTKDKFHGMSYQDIQNHDNKETYRIGFLKRKGYQVYSVGKDGIDDDGISYGDITFKVIRK